MIDDFAADTPHAEQDENYFVSMTDMMVGILFVFIILLMVFALNFRTHTDVSDERLKKLEAAAQQAQTVADKLEGLQAQVRDEVQSIDAATKVRAEMLEEIKKRLADAGLKVDIDTVNGVLRLTQAAINFDSDSSDLSGLAATNVQKVADALAAVLPTYAAGGPAAVHVETVFIEGHTDTSGIDDRNWVLSTQRALATFQLVTKLQAPLRSLRNDNNVELIAVSGYSSTRPALDDDGSIAPYAVQRRIDLRFVMEVDDRRRLDALEGLTGDMQDQLTILRQAVEAARGQ